MPDTLSEIPLLRDLRTCREKQDEAIETIRQRTNYTATLAADLLHELEALRARVAALEAAHGTCIDAMPITGAPSDSAFTIHTDGTLERNAEPEASTATPGQTYTWLPGDAWSQYCEAQP